MNTATTNLVAACTNYGSQTIIARDLGQDTRCTGNVRKLDILQTLNVSVTDAAFTAVITDNESAGSGWGDIGNVYTITQDNVDMLIAAHDAKTVQKNETEELAPRNVGWCDRCKSYCYGDC